MLAALGFGALSSIPQQAVAVAVSAAPPPLTVSTTLDPSDGEGRHAVRPTTMVMLEVAPAPTPTAVATTPLPTAAPERVVAPVQRAATIAPAPARAIGPVSGSGNGFAYGYCTWWVAHKRYIPWRGNAAQWWWNARPFGYAEGSTPRPGAIMVMGVSGTSPEGHVGYVESTNPDGSFVVSEMNWWGVPGGGWGRVDYRTVTSLRGILGFIY